MTSEFELTDDTPVYVISVAAQLSGLHPQTLRAYDRLGLVSPARSPGRGRRYSLRDVLILREVQRLSQEEGINLQGIKRILELELAEQRSKLRLAEMHAEISQLRAELESTRAVAARLATLLRSGGQGGALVPVRDGGAGRAAPGQPADVASAVPPDRGATSQPDGETRPRPATSHGQPAAAAGHADLG
jgi:MerR family transcriptional regulator, heat shock protein HspR